MSGHFIREDAALVLRKKPRKKPDTVQLRSGRMEGNMTKRTERIARLARLARILGKSVTHIVAASCFFWRFACLLKAAAPAPLPEKRRYSGGEVEREVQ